MSKKLMRIGFICSLAVLCGAAHSDNKIPNNWKSAGPVIETGSWKPIYDLFEGPAKVIGRSKAPKGFENMLSMSQIFVIWSKAVFRTPRKTENNMPYMSEVMQIKINCPSSSFTVLRDIKYAANNTIISDQKNLWKAKHIDRGHATGMGDLPLDLAFAVDRYEFTCLRDTE